MRGRSPSFTVDISRQRLDKDMKDLRDWRGHSRFLGTLMRGVEVIRLPARFEGGKRSMRGAMLMRASFGGSIGPSRRRPDGVNWIGSRESGVEQL